MDSDELPGNLLCPQYSNTSFEVWKNLITLIIFMVKLDPNRSKLPNRRMIIYILILFILVFFLLLWNRFANLLPS